MGNEIIQAQVMRRIVLAAPVQVGPPEDRVLRLCVSDESRDRYKSIIRCDGWKTDNYAKNPVVLFAHDSAQPPIGSGKAFNTTSEMRPYVTQHPKRAMDEGKMGKFSRWFADTGFAKRETYPFADIIYKLFLDKHLRATSVGFNPLDSKQLNHEDQLGEDWARDLTELEIGDVVHRTQELLEYSAVPIPGNQNAVVESLKLWVPGLRSLETKTAECVRSFLASPSITDDGWVNAAELDTESDFAKTCREFQGLLLLTKELMAAEPQSETKVTSGWTKEIEAIAVRLEQGGGSDSDEDPGDDLTHEPEGKDAGWVNGGVDHKTAEAGSAHSEKAAGKHDSHAAWHDAKSAAHQKDAQDASAQGQTDGSTGKDDFGRAAEQHAEAADQHTALSSAHKVHANLLGQYAKAKKAGDDLKSARLGRSVRNSKNDIDDKNARLRGFYKRTEIEKPGKDDGGEDAQKGAECVALRTDATRYNDNHDDHGKFSDGPGGGGKGGKDGDDDSAKMKYHQDQHDTHAKLAKIHLETAKSQIQQAKSASGAAKAKYFESAKDHIASATEHTAIASHHAEEMEKTAGIGNKKYGGVSQARKAAQPAPASGQDPESNPDPAADQGQMDHEQGEITDREELRETLQEAIADIDDATGRIQEALGMLDDADQDDQEQMDNIRPEDAEPANLSGAAGKSGKDSQPGPQYAVSYFSISKRFDEHHSSGGDHISGDHRGAAYGASSASSHHRHHGSFHDTMALKHGEESVKGGYHYTAAHLHHDLARAYDRHSMLHHAAADLKDRVEQEKQGKSVGPNAVQPLGNLDADRASQRSEPIADAKRLGEMIGHSGKSIIGKRTKLHDHLKAMTDAGHHANPSDCRDYRSYDAPKDRVRTLPSTRLIEKLMADAFQKAATEVRDQLMPCLNGLAKRSELSTFMIDLDEVKRSLKELSARSSPLKSPVPPPAPKAPAPGGEPKEPDRKAAAEHHEKLLRETRSQAAALLSRMDSLVAASMPPQGPPKAPKFPHREGKPEATK